MTERVSRGRIEFDSLTEREFEDLVCETLEQSEFIELEHMDDGVVIHELHGGNEAIQQRVQAELDNNDVAWDVQDVQFEECSNRSQYIDLVRYEEIGYAKTKVGARAVDAIRSAGLEVSAWFPNANNDVDRTTMRVWVNEE